MKYVDEWAIYHKWTPRNGTITTNADDQCCMQTYLDRYEMSGEKHMLDSCRMNMEKQMSLGRTDYWTWIDAIQMSMPAYSKMSRITGDTRYVLFARDCYEWTRNKCGGGLWNAQEGLWWRDADFVPPYKESDGNNCYWSRGNGWVVAALVRTIEDIEGSRTPCRGNMEVQAFCEELKSDYKTMMQALLRCQREDGFWNVSLMSPATFGGPETSGTALFLMGMAWGIRNGILPAEEYRSATDKAWHAIATKAIHQNGFIGYLQGTGKEPKDGQPVTYTSVPNFEDYGTGCVLLGAVEYYKLIKDLTSQAGARWWWLGSAVTETGLTWQMEQLASHGIGTLEITPLYGVRGNEANNISFLSPEWMKMLDYTINEGKRLGIQIDMNLGTGWPFGSPETPLEEAACKVVAVDSLVDSKLAKSILLPAPQKERYARLVTQRDYKSHVKGKRRVIALYECRTCQKVKRAAPGGEGYVIDHFDSVAVAHYLARFDKAFKASGALMPATFFNDSYEVFGADWTPTLPKEFEARRGYKLEDKLQEFVDGDAQVLSDYRETLSDLLLQNFTEQWVRWSHERGVKVRNQAHGSPANLIDIYAAVDVPEIEGFGLSEFGIKGLRTDPGMTRRNFSDLSMLKYASSAAHITGKRLVSSETFTWLTEHFRTSLSQMKPDLDLMFCAGVNRMFFHGTCYSPKDDPWPGWRFYASVDMSPANSIWRDAVMLTSYIYFCQERLQDGEPDNDFLVLLPVRNMWRTNLDKRLMLFDINSMDEKAPEFIASILKIDSLGYDCDYISEKYLLSTTFTNGKLQTVAGTRYAALILPPGCIMSKAVKKHIESLKRQGAHIIYNIDAQTLAKHAKPEDLRTQLHMKMIRRKVDDGYRYFVSNLTPNDVEREITLASTGVKVNLSLRSGESCFIDAVNKGNTIVTYPLNARHASGKPSLLTDLTSNKWTLSFIDSQPVINQEIAIDGLRTWESLPVDSLSELMGTGVYETTFLLSAADAVASGSYRIDLGDVRESARVYINDSYIGCAWCVPFALDFDGILHEGENTIRIEVTNLPANRIAAYDRRGIKWRKFNEINVVDINYKHSTYADWTPVLSGLNSYVHIYIYTEKP